MDRRLPALAPLSTAVGAQVFDLMAARQRLSIDAGAVAAMLRPHAAESHLAGQSTLLADPLPPYPAACRDPDDGYLVAARELASAHQATPLITRDNTNRSRASRAVTRPGC